MIAMDYGNLTIIIPTLNEAGNIGRLIKILSSSYPNAKIIVSDDGSHDGTKEEVTKYGKKADAILLDRSQKTVHGLTASVVDAATTVRTRYIIVMDADLQHPPEAVGKIYDKLLNGADIAIATRTSVENWSLYRKMVSLGITAIATMVFKARHKPVTRDMMSGFFGIRARLFKNLISRDIGGFIMGGYKVLLDTLRMVGDDTVIAEVPYSTFHSREHGRSKFKPNHMLETLRSIFR